MKKMNKVWPWKIVPKKNSTLDSVNSCLRATFTIHVAEHSCIIIVLKKRSGAVQVEKVFSIVTRMIATHLLRPFSMMAIHASLLHAKFVSLWSTNLNYAKFAWKYMYYDVMRVIFILFFIIIVALYDGNKVFFFGKLFCFLWDKKKKFITNFRNNVVTFLKGRITRDKAILILFHCNRYVVNALYSLWILWCIRVNKMFETLYYIISIWYRYIRILVKCIFKQYSSSHSSLKLVFTDQ